MFSDISSESSGSSSPVLGTEDMPQPMPDFGDFAYMEDMQALVERLKSVPGSLFIDDMDICDIENDLMRAEKVISSPKDWFDPYVLRDLKDALMDAHSAIRIYRSMYNLLDQEVALCAKRSGTSADLKNQFARSGMIQESSQQHDPKRQSRSQAARIRLKLYQRSGLESWFKTRGAYASAAEVHYLAAKYGMHVCQVRRWFSNKRRYLRSHPISTKLYDIVSPESAPSPDIEVLENGSWKTVALS